MGICDKKKTRKNLKRCGEKALVKGVDETILVAMKDEQEVAITYDATNSTLATGIALKAGEKMFAYEGKNASNDPSVGFNKTDYDTTLPQQLVFVIFSNSPATKLEIEALITRDDLLFIVKRKQADYEIYGAETGMSVSAFVYRANDDNKGAFVVTVAAPDEASLPKTLRIAGTGGLDGTKAALAALTAADA
jgi:hypothetical protein